MILYCVLRKTSQLLFLDFMVFTIGNMKIQSVSVGLKSVGELDLRY
ncbi:hypothetical protein Q672_09225 [Marinobacter sp. EVN1]|nr:hypothetical protein Q672_09225 [Marinobacter sp. EVN1]